MPSPIDFKKHFELGKGAQVGREFIVQSSQVGHVVREENEVVLPTTPLELLLVLLPQPALRPGAAAASHPAL